MLALRTPPRPSRTLAAARFNNGQERLATLHDNVVLLEGSKNVILAVLSAVSIVAMALAVLLILNGQRWW